MGKTALTGGIGSGKSYVCSLLRQRGIEVYDCDSAAKRIISEKESVREQLRRLIGPDTFVDGSLNKTAVSAFLLASHTNAEAINAIVHPAVADDFECSDSQWMECAILYESGFDRLVDTVIAVSAPLETRIRRIMKRDGVSRQRALEWINRQMPAEEVERRAKFIVVNDGQMDVDAQLDAILAQL